MGYNKETTEMDGGNESQFQNTYDPDREYQQRLMAYEMYGNQGVTGQDFNFYNPYQSGYAGMPHWNYVNNPDGPDPNRIGLPPGGIGTGGGQPNEVPNTEPDPEAPEAGGPRRPRVVGPRPVGPATGGQGGGQPPVRGRGANGGGLMNAYGMGGGHAASAEQRAGSTNPDEFSARGRGQSINPAVLDQRVSTVPGGPGTPENPSANPNQDPNDPWDNGDPYGDPDAPGGGDYYSNGPGGPGHGSWINGNQGGISGPMVRPADRNSNALYAGAFDDWGQGGASGNEKIASGKLYDMYSELMKHPDLPDNVKSAIITGANEGANAQYDSAQGALQRYGRTTGNRAGNAAATAALGKSRADTAANTNRQVQLDFENEKTKRRQEGAAGMGNLYQTEGNKLFQLFGLRGALSQKPIAGRQQGSNHGLSIGNGFNFSIG